MNGTSARENKNTADADAYVERAVWLPISAASLSDDARKYGEPVSMHVELRALPNGELYIYRIKRDTPVWLQVQELIDP